MGNVIRGLVGTVLLVTVLVLGLLVGHWVCTGRDISRTDGNFGYLLGFIASVICMVAFVAVFAEALPEKIGATMKAQLFLGAMIGMSFPAAILWNQVWQNVHSLPRLHDYDVWGTLATQGSLRGFWSNLGLVSEITVGLGLASVYYFVKAKWQARRGADRSVALDRVFA